MSENNSNNGNESIEINGLFAFKEGMATVFDDSGEAIPVTILRYEPWIVTQIKTILLDTIPTKKTLFNKKENNSVVNPR